MDSYNSYPSIYNMGHRAVADLLKEPVLVEEKIDGSQFSFGKESDGTLRCRSKGAEINLDAPEKMFAQAVATVRMIAPDLQSGWTYRGEYLAKPGHNTLVYDRVPFKNIMIFDINTGDQEYLDYPGKKAEAQRIGLETVPLLHYGLIESVEAFRALLETTSVLGGQKIEGVVIKPYNYNLWARDKKCLMGKFVSESFRESHSHAWKEKNQTQNDIVALIGSKYAAEGRWTKALQHLTEAGLITDSPKDIGALMKEIHVDVLKECEDEIKQHLFNWAWPHIQRGLTRGFPEFYKELLLRKRFD